MQFETVQVKIPEQSNVIIGQSHFIKTVEDIYEALVGTVPGIQFGIAFCEASGKCLIRSEGNDAALKATAEQTAQQIGAGHSFVIFMKNGFPINVMAALQAIPEICRIFCATANPLQIIVAESEQGRGIMGVIDGVSPKGVEKAEDIAWRRDLLRKLKYKL